MSLTASLNTSINNVIDFTPGGSLRVAITIATTGNYATHGVTLDLSQLGIPTELVPNDFNIFETPAAGASASGSDYLFVAGTTLANGVVQIFKAGSEQSNGTGFPTTTLAAVFWFPSL